MGTAQEIRARERDTVACILMCHFPRKYEMGTVMGTETGTGRALDGHWTGTVYSLGMGHIVRLLLFCCCVACLLVLARLLILARSLRLLASLLALAPCLSGCLRSFSQFASMSVPELKTMSLDEREPLE